MPVIDWTYPLTKVPEAIRHLERGYARGKVVITVRGANRRSAWALKTYGSASAVGCGSGLMFWLSRKRFVGS